MTSDKLSILHLGVLAMTRLCQTLLNHYYGNWFYVLPYRLLYIVQLCVFTHDCSVLLTVSPPPPGKYIHGGREERRREGGKAYEILLYSTLAVQYYFTPEFYSIWFYSWRTDIDGHPEPRRFYRDMTSLVCLTVHLLLYKDIFLKYCFCTRAKTQNAATSLLLLYCRSVHGTVHLLYCINTHTLYT